MQGGGGSVSLPVSKTCLQSWIAIALVLEMSTMNPFSVFVFVPSVWTSLQWHLQRVCIVVYSLHAFGGWVTRVSQ